MNNEIGDNKRILAINFGGIGDEILFLPTLKTIKSVAPSSSITLLLEPRSRSVEQLTTLVDDVLTFDIKKRPLLVGDLLDLLMLIKEGGYDCVVSSGGSPMVAGLLFLSGIRERIGYGTSALSRLLLTCPVNLNKNQYAADMYHDLAIGFARRLNQGGSRTGSGGGQRSIPEVNLHQESVERMTELLKNLGITGSGRRTVVLHPGSSRLATKKGIYKTWPTDRWLELLSLIGEFNKKSSNDTDRILVVLAGGPDDSEIIEEIQTGYSTKKRQQDKESPDLVSVFGKTKNI